MSTRIHTCVYFDDGELEHLCACGARAMLVLDEQGEAGLVALLPAETEIVIEYAATA